jgi:ASC-1-like (ASCH) protein
MSYGLAYGFDLHDPKKELVANASGSRLLVNVKVRQRIVKLLNDTLQNEIVDAEMAKVILQDDELASKMAGIREYNKLRNRVKETPDNSVQPEVEAFFAWVRKTLPASK